MTFADADPRAAGRHRPLWLPHPKLLALIALLWVLAGAFDALTWLKP